MKLNKDDFSPYARFHFAMKGIEVTDKRTKKETPKYILWAKFKGTGDLHKIVRCIHPDYVFGGKSI